MRAIILSFRHGHGVGAFVPSELLALALRDTIVFPLTLQPLGLTRRISILRAAKVTFDDAVIRRIASEYTSEAGVRTSNHRSGAAPAHRNLHPAGPEQGAPR